MVNTSNRRAVSTPGQVQQELILSNDVIAAIASAVCLMQAEMSQRREEALQEKLDILEWELVYIKQIVTERGSISTSELKTLIAESLQNGASSMALASPGHPPTGAHDDKIMQMIQQIVREVTHIGKRLDLLEKVTLSHPTLSVLQSTPQPTTDFIPAEISAAVSGTLVSGSASSTPATEASYATPLPDTKTRYKTPDTKPIQGRGKKGVHSGKQPDTDRPIQTSDTKATPDTEDIARDLDTLRDYLSTHKKWTYVTVERDLGWSHSKVQRRLARLQKTGKKAGE